MLLSIVLFWVRSASWESVSPDIPALKGCPVASKNLRKVQKCLCLILAFLSVAGDCQGSNAGRGVGGKPAERRSLDTLPF